MFTSLRARILVILAAVGVSGWYMYANWSATSRACATRADLEQPCSPSILTMGLDLQGGMHLVLEVDDPDGVMTVDQRSDAIDRAERVIRGRVDELGVSEPLIQKVGRDRLIVELAGITDDQRAKGIIGQTALLEWKLMAPRSTAEAALPRIDQAIVAALGVDSLRALGRAVEDSQAAAGGTVSDAFFRRGAAGDTAAAPAADADTVTAAEPESNLRPFSSLLLNGPNGEFLVPSESYELAAFLLALPEVEAVLPRGISLQWGWEPTALGGAIYRPLYVLERDAFITGERLVDAQAIRDPQYNMPVVTFELDRQGGRRFEDITGQNIGNYIAIVLDDEVVSAAVVRSRIGSRGQIELGGSPLEEARDLALVLRAGALPAPLRIMEERTVGPSLGQDSIDQGQIAGLVGIALVILMMIGYYRVVGALAVAALGVYVTIVLGGLAAIGAALTLPGIAGLVLSVGMAVDANVLIFERIREELDAGRPVRTAVDEGFRNALSAIVDANVTTLFTALILYYVGTGSVQGFAITLSIGIVASFFTALYVTRTACMIYVGERRPRESISI